MPMVGRNYNQNSYRFGYQGSEMDNEHKGNGNSYTTYFRQLDPRLGRWMSIDPVVQPWQSPYTSMDNNPIKFNDPMGDKISMSKGTGGGKFGNKSRVKKNGKVSKGRRLNINLGNIKIGGNGKLGKTLKTVRKVNRILKQVDQLSDKPNEPTAPASNRSDSRSSMNSESNRAQQSIAVNNTILGEPQNIPGSMPPQQTPNGVEIYSVPGGVEGGLDPNNRDADGNPKIALPGRGKTLNGKGTWVNAGQLFFAGLSSRPPGASGVARNAPRPGVTTIFAGARLEPSGIEIAGKGELNPNRWYFRWQAQSGGAIKTFYGSIPANTLGVRWR